MKTITLSRIIPLPLSQTLKTHPEESHIWDTKVSFNTSKKYQVYAKSGKGKSTFIHIIYGLRKDFTGEVVFDENNINNLKPKSWAEIRQNIFSIVFQDLRLFLDLTAWENIQVNTALYPKQEDDTIKEMAESLGVSHVLDKKTSTLSYGERQRIAIIRALVQPFSFLLLDEPFSHLDEENIQKASKLIHQKCKDNQAGFVMTSLGYDYPLEIDEKLLL